MVSVATCPAGPCGGRIPGGNRAGEKSWNVWVVWNLRGRSRVQSDQLNRNEENERAEST